MIIIHKLALSLISVISGNKWGQMKLLLFYSNLGLPILAIKAPFLNVR